MILQVHQVPLIKYWLIVIALSLLVACNTKKEMPVKPSQIPVVENRSELPYVLSDLVVLQANTGITYYKEKPFTGYSIEFYNKDQFSKKVEFKNGKKDGLYEMWFEDGVLSYQANYKQGKLNGKAVSWWGNGNKRSEANYVNGIAEGVQMQWYISGVKFKKITLVNGREEGMQQSWRENGKIYNNYEAKNGRIFGLKRSKLCYELDDEEVQYKN